MKTKEKLILLFYRTRQVLKALLYSDVLIFALCLLYQNGVDLWLYYTVLVLSGLAVYEAFSWSALNRQIDLLTADDFQSDDYPRRESIFIEKMAELEQRNMQEKSEYDAQKQQLKDYFSMWAHQAKLPVSAMNLLLASDSPDIPALKEQAARMEQYVHSVMAYVRLNSASTDYVFRPLELDTLIRKVIRNNSSFFIQRKIRMDFQETGMHLITDSKWLEFVLEQILSNAIKYSPSGSTIHIYGDAKNRTLTIEDEGTGIEEEDLPRIFELGFTGMQGRENRESSGIGLYLCHEILQKMNAQIEIRSVKKRGTEVQIRFPENPVIRD